MEHQRLWTKRKQFHDDGENYEKAKFMKKEAVFARLLFKLRGYWLIL